MANSAPTDPKAKSDENPTPAAPVEPPFEEKLRKFWEKNSRTVYALCAVVLLVIIGRGGWEYYERQREAGIESDYQLASTPEKLKAFINANPQHTLSGIAWLRLADEAYSAGNYTDAQTNYQRAADILKNGALGGRARLGAALSQLGLARSSEGEEKLKQIANDSTQLKAVRAEAACHLAILALDAGRNDDAAKWFDQTSSIDMNGIWAQRAMMLRTTLPPTAPAASVTPAAAPTVKIPGK